MHLDETESMNILRCLTTCRHHCDPTKFVPGLNEAGRIRVLKIESGLKKAAEQIQKIHALGERTKNIELLNLLSEQFEFGADVP